MIFQTQGFTHLYSYFFSLTGALGLDLLSKEIVKSIIKQEFSGFFRFHSRVLGLNEFSSSINPSSKNQRKLERWISISLIFLGGQEKGGFHICFVSYASTFVNLVKFVLVISHDFV
jgi:hypothetical protein